MERLGTLLRNEECIMGLHLDGTKMVVVGGSRNERRAAIFENAESWNKPLYQRTLHHSAEYGHITVEVGGDQVLFCADYAGWRHSLTSWRHSLTTEDEQAFRMPWRWRAYCLSPNGRYFAVTSNIKEVAIYDMFELMRLVAEVANGPTNYYNESIQWSPDGTRIHIISPIQLDNDPEDDDDEDDDDQEERVLMRVMRVDIDAHVVSEVCRVVVSDDGVIANSTAAWSPCGKYIVTGDRAIRRAEALDQVVAHVKRDHGDYNFVYKFVWSPCGRWIAVLSSHVRCHEIWRVTESQGKLTTTLRWQGFAQRIALIKCLVWLDPQRIVDQCIKCLVWLDPQRLAFAHDSTVCIFTVCDWSPRTNRSFPAAVRERIFTAMCCFARLGLPTELQLLCFELMC